MEGCCLLEQEEQAGLSGRKVVFDGSLARIAMRAELVDIECIRAKRWNERGGGSRGCFLTVT